MISATAAIFSPLIGERTDSVPPARLAAGTPRRPMMAVTSAVKFRLARVMVFLPVIADVPLLVVFGRPLFRSAPR
ncbi:hypothetical protein D3C72_2338780 [compost metagenome]